MPASCRVIRCAARAADNPSGKTTAGISAAGPQLAVARLADQYIGAARLASVLVRPGAPADATEDAQPLLMEDVVRGDPWGWFMAERASLVRLVRQVHAARLCDRTWKLADMLPV